MRLPLRDIASITGAALAPAGEATGYSIDTRTLAAGDLFFAIRGDTHDGHDYVHTAFERGACAAVVDHPIEFAAGPLLCVEDVLAALQTLAREARARWGRTVVAITGSAGKTTTKDIVAKMLAARLKTGSTSGNLNNHLGLPVSILRIPDDAEAAVFEMGMNHPGEIRTLASIGRPDIGVVTNVGYAHIENFDSIDGIALAKRELIEALPPNGTAVLNGDDPRVAAFASVHPGPVLRYGTGPDADVRAEEVTLSDSGVRFRVRGVAFDSPLTGMHGVRNILAGLATAQVFGIPPEALGEVVRSLEPGAMRGRREERKGFTIINDCYNANPDAVRSMLDVLRETPARRRIAVLGEMLELGRWAEPLHRDIGSYAAGGGISVLLGIRGAARFMVDAAMNAATAVDAAYFFQEPEEAGKALAEIARPGDAILFKGSRGTRVERALDAFLELAP